MKTSSIENPACRKTTRPRGYIAYYNPQRATGDLLSDVMGVLEEYRNYWPLTCRQIFYRLVGAYGYDKSEAFYARLCHHMANARRAKVLPFEAIRDDGVMTVALDHYADADEFRAKVRGMARRFRRNVMERQPVHMEVWCEAAGMITQLANVAERYSVRAYSSSGFDSLTAKKDLADRICRIGKPAIILHLGDYDPSGASMFEVIGEDVAAFVRADRPWANLDVEFHRVALTRDQVEHFNLPTAPAKASDSRSKRWEGETCQLEALSPDQIAAMLEQAIVEWLDMDLMEQDFQAAAVEREELTALLLTGPEITASPRNDGGVR